MEDAEFVERADALIGRLRARGVDEAELDECERLLAEPEVACYLCRDAGCWLCR